MDFSAAPSVVIAGCGPGGFASSTGKDASEGTLVSWADIAAYVLCRRGYIIGVGIKMRCTDLSA